MKIDVKMVYDDETGFPVNAKITDVDEEHRQVAVSDRDRQIALRAYDLGFDDGFDRGGGEQH